MTNSGTRNDFLQYILPPCRIFRNGQRLKKGESRPEPFYVKCIANKCLPFYQSLVTKQLFRRMIFGAYSRKYDRVRKRRKRRLF